MSLNNYSKLLRKLTLVTVNVKAGKATFAVNTGLINSVLEKSKYSFGNLCKIARVEMSG